MVIQLVKDFWRDVRELDGRLLTVLILGGFLLCCDFYFDTYETSEWLLMPYLPEGTDPRFGKNLLSTISCYFFLLFVPCLVIVYGFRESVADYGLVSKGFLADTKLGISLYLLMLPLLILVTYFQSFQDYYPMYGGSSSDLKLLLLYELTYGLYFIGWEFFFRGFLLFGVEKKFGLYSVFLWASLFTAMHFGKPGPESMGAIVCAVVLGYIAYKTRSIWAGVVAHATVAVTLDLLVIFLPKYG